MVRCLPYTIIIIAVEVIKKEILQRLAERKDIGKFEKVVTV